MEVENFNDYLNFADSPYPVTEQQMSVVLDYKNPSGIADAVCPVFPALTQTFEYKTFDKKDRRTVPDSEVSRKGDVNIAEFGGSSATAKCQDYGLATVIPKSDLDNAIGSKIDIVNHRTEMIMNLLELDIEL